jgi:hypothetical protein
VGRLAVAWEVVLRRRWVWWRVSECRPKCVRRNRGDVRSGTDQRHGACDGNFFHPMMPNPLVQPARDSRYGLQIRCHRSRAADHRRSSLAWRSSRHTNPEGWNTVAGGRSQAETPGGGSVVFSILEGCQRAATPPGSTDNCRRRPGGIAALNPRPPSGKPPACSEAVAKTKQWVQAAPGYASLFIVTQVPGAPECERSAG